jgi:hypothetical protein
MSSTEYSGDFFHELNLSLLTEKEHKELIDFYNILIQKHKTRRLHRQKESDEKPEKKHLPTLLSLPVKPFQPLKREDVYAR